MRQVFGDVDPEGALAQRGMTEGNRKFAITGIFFEALEIIFDTQIPRPADLSAPVFHAPEIFGAFHFPQYFFDDFPVVFFQFYFESTF